VITPPLDGTILGGATRDCTLILLREWGVRVEERTVGLDEIERARAGGKLLELFGTGTAAIVAPIGKLGLASREIIIGNGEEGDLTRRLYDTIRGIQGGTVADRYEWLVPLDR
jgi:branched-chain amino acid aminotransferase